MNIYESEEVINRIKKAKIIVVEGYDLTGKSFFIKQLSKFLSYKTWEPYKETIPYDDRYALGISLIDLVEKGVVTDPIIINRGLPSGLVYSDVYGQDVPAFLNKNFLKYATEKYSNSDLIHTIYILHHDIKNAEYIYNASTNRSSNESYDLFEDFDDYMINYMDFHKAFKSVLKRLCSDNFTAISSVDCEVLK